MSSPFTYILITGLFCGIWPLIARFSGLGTGWTSLLFGFGTGIVALFSGVFGSPVPPMKSMAIGLFAGSVNGLGLLAFAKLLGWKEIDPSSLIPTTFAVIIIFSAVGAATLHYFSPDLFPESLTAKKLIALGLIVVGVYFLK